VERVLQWAVAGILPFFPKQKFRRLPDSALRSTLPRHKQSNRGCANHRPLALGTEDVEIRTSLIQVLSQYSVAEGADITHHIDAVVS